DGLLLRPQRHDPGVPRGALVPQAVVRALVPAGAGLRGPAGPCGGAEQLSGGAPGAQRRSSRRRTARQAAGISIAASAALPAPPGRKGHRPAASTPPRPISAPITAFMIIARYGTPTRKGTALAATKPARASTGRRSQARSANQPATQAAGTKPRMKPKLGASTEAGPPLHPGDTGAPARATSREVSSAAAPRREPSAAPTRITPRVCPVIGTSGSGMVTWARRATTAVPASTRPASCTRVRCGARASARTGRRAGTAIADMGLLGAGIGRGPDYVVLGSDPEGSLA